MGGHDGPEYAVVTLNHKSELFGQLVPAFK
jgi:hypothetical protein